MKHTWNFSDGTVATWTDAGTLEAAPETKLAENIRYRSSWPPDSPFQVEVIPCDTVDLDLRSIVLVDLFLRAECGRLGIDLVSSTYEPKDEDMPPHVAEKVLRARQWGPEEPGVRY